MHASKVRNMKKEPRIKYPLTRKGYRKLRNYWKPDSVEALFVAEAPPEDRRSYFFNHKTGIGHGLFSYITCGLNIRGKTKEKRLKEFEKENFWLIDVFQEPIEDVKKKDVESHLAEFESELERVKPKKTVIVIPKRRLGSAWRYLVSMYLLQDYGKDQLIGISEWSWSEFNKKLKELRIKS